MARTTASGVDKSSSRFNANVRHRQIFISDEDISKDLTCHCLEESLTFTLHCQRPAQVRTSQVRLCSVTAKTKRMVILAKDRLLKKALMCGLSGPTPMARKG